MPVLPFEACAVHYSQKSNYESLREDLSTTFSSLKTPNFIELTALRGAKERLAPYSITSVTENVSCTLKLDVWFEMLEAAMLPKDFLTVLNRFSTLRGGAPEFESLKVGAFCELRAAYAIASLKLDAKVFVAPQNSAADAAGVDLSVEFYDGTSVPIQVKATEEKKHRLKQGIPTLRNVLRLPLTEIASSAQRLITSR